MRNLLFLIAILLVLAWSLGLLTISATNLVYLLVVLGLIGLLLAVLRRQYPG